MKNELLIFLPFAILALIVLCWAIWAIRAFTQPLNPEDYIPVDEAPGRYEEVEYCERPYMEML